MTDQAELARVKLLESTHREELDAIFFCPGCQNHHPFRILSEIGRPVWTWNQDLARPTFEPSLLVDQHTPERRCHSFVRDGRIQFLEDCHHALKGQTVDLPPIAETWS